MISSVASRVSALVLATGGVALLFNLLKAKDPSVAARVLTVPMGIMGLVYAALLVRGSFDRPPAS